MKLLKTFNKLHKTFILKIIKTFNKLHKTTHEENNNHTSIYKNTLEFTL